MKSSTLLPLLIGATGIMAQNNASSPNGCSYGFYPGTDTVIFTVPYTYAQVMSIIGDYQYLTWSGSPAGSVTLNGTDDTVGTARTYDIAGAHVTETITAYSKPPNGPYEEIHTLDLLTIPSANVSFYGDYDGTTVTPICNGGASTFNFTINFCASNATIATGILHMLHLTDAQTVGVFLGGQNFSSCVALSSSTATTTSTPPMVTANSATLYTASTSTFILVAGVWLPGWDCRTKGEHATTTRPHGEGVREVNCLGDSEFMLFLTLLPTKPPRLFWLCSQSRDVPSFPLFKQQGLHIPCISVHPTYEAGTLSYIILEQLPMQAAWAGCMIRTVRPSASANGAPRVLPWMSLPKTAKSLALPQHQTNQSTHQHVLPRSYPCHLSIALSPLILASAFCYRE